MKDKRKNKVYSVEFKLKAVQMYKKKEKTQQEIIDELGLSSRSYLQRWAKTYDKHGIEGLKRGSGRVKGSKNNKKSNSEKQKMIELEAENALLKKLLKYKGGGLKK